MVAGNGPLAQSRRDEEDRRMFGGSSASPTSLDDRESSPRTWGRRPSTRGFMRDLEQGLQKSTGQMLLVTDPFAALFVDLVRPRNAPGHTRLIRVALISGWLSPSRHHALPPGLQGFRSPGPEPVVVKDVSSERTSAGPQLVKRKLTRPTTEGGRGIGTWRVRGCRDPRSRRSSFRQSGLS